MRGGRWVGCAALASALVIGQLAAAPLRLATRAPAPLGAAVLTGEQGKPGKLSPRLATMAAAAGSASPSARALSLPATGVGRLIQRPRGRVLVEIRMATLAPAAIAALTALGAQVVNVSHAYSIVTASVTPASLHAIAADAAVRYVSEVLAPQVGSVGSLHATPEVAAAGCAPIVSEGDGLMNVATARATSGLDGTGETIGILSDSFDTAAGATTHAADDVAAGDLPGPGNPCGYTSPVTVQADYSGGGQDDEGRAMAQLAHALAPGAHLAFATADNGDLDLANEIDKLRMVNHASVLVDDVTYLDEPFFQDGPLANAVSASTAAGVPYFSAAGNANAIVGGDDVSSYEAPVFRPMPCPALDEAVMSCHDFDPGGGASSGDSITLAPGGGFGLDLQWAEPWGAVSTDLDAFVVSASGAILAESEVKNSESGMPFEFLDYGNSTSSPQTVKIVIAKYSGDADPRLKFVLMGAAGISAVQFHASSGGDIVGPSIFGHNGTGTVGSTAAIPYDNPDTSESFSARGPETLYFEPAPSTAALATPEVLAKPDFAASDGVQTSFFAQSIGGVWRFYGTSAAAPQAAAIAALLIDKDPLLSPAGVMATLRSTARAVATNGTADAVGGGYLDADAALASVSAHAGAPQSVGAIADDGRADLSWSAPLTDGGLPITGYTVTPYVADSPQTPQTFPGTSTSAVATGLTNGTMYTFTVNAVDANGAGPPSDPSASVTVGVPSAPGAVSAVSSGSGRAALTWLAPTSTNGAKITAYILAPFLGGVPQPQQLVPPGTTGTATGLTNGYDYTFEVAAMSNRGTGAFSAPTDPVIIGVPGRPTIRAVSPANSGAVISFTAPPANGAPITNYAFIAYVGTNFYEEGRLSTATTQTVGVPNGQEFRFTVSAINGAGEGPQSALSAAVVAGAPDAVAAPRAAPGNGRATLHWTLAPNNGAAVTHYVVTPYLGNVAQPARTFPGGTTSAAVTGLRNGKHYGFTIVAVNARGAGPQSVATPVDVGSPSRPTDVSAVPGRHSATVRWRAAGGNGSTITGYVVTPYIGAVRQSARVFHSRVVTRVISGLTPGKAYRFTVAAMNARGTGPDSQSSNAVTVG